MASQAQGFSRLAHMQIRLRIAGPEPESQRLCFRWAAWMHYVPSSAGFWSVLTWCHLSGVEDFLVILFATDTQIRWMLLWMYQRTILVSVQKVTLCRSMSPTAQMVAHSYKRGTMWAEDGASLALPMIKPTWHWPSLSLTLKYATAAIAMVAASEKIHISLFWVQDNEAGT